MSGLLINGRLVQVEGETIIGPGDAAWSHLSPGDSRPRDPHFWVRQWFLHKTIADDPEILIPGTGPSGGAERTVTGWQEEFAGSHRFAGAHFVTGHDGVTACLADLVTVETFHATVSNAWSVGHETCELVGGKCYSAALASAVNVCIAGCRALGIQLQMPRVGSYTGHPIKRMIHGGEDMVGIFGHRDNTEARGKWDPGEEMFALLAARGVEQWDFDAGEDRDVWGGRQRVLNQTQEMKLTEDGVPGPATVAALRAAGHADGIWVAS